METNQMRRGYSVLISALMIAQVAAGGVVSASAATEGPTLLISSFTFKSITVKPGERFLVKNTDSADHTLKIAGTKIDPLVHAKAFIIVTAPAKPGTYKLSCDFHPTMHGVLKVTR